MEICIGKSLPEECFQLGARAIYSSTSTLQKFSSGSLESSSASSSLIVAGGKKIDGRGVGRLKLEREDTDGAAVRCSRRNLTIGEGERRERERADNRCNHRPTVVSKGVKP